MRKGKQIVSLLAVAACYATLCGSECFASDPSESSNTAVESKVLEEERRQTKALLERLAANAANAVENPSAAQDSTLLKKLQASEKAQRQLQFQQESFISEILRLKTKIRELEAQSPEAEEEASKKREEDLLEQLRLERVRAEKYKRSAGDTEQQFHEIQRAERKAKDLAGALDQNRLIMNKREKKIAELEARINELQQGGVKNAELRDSLIKARQAAQRFEVQLEQRKHLETDNNFLREELAKIKAEAKSSSNKKANINLLEKKVEESNAVIAELRAQKQALEAHLSTQGHDVATVKRLAEKVKTLERSIEEKDKVIATTTGLGSNIKKLQQEIAAAKQETLKVATQRDNLKEELAERNALLDKHRQALLHVKEKIDSHDSVLHEKEEELLATKRQLSKTIEETRICSLSKEEISKEIEQLPNIAAELNETKERLAAANSSVKQCASDLDSSRQLLSKLSELEKDLIAAKNELMLKDTEISLLSKAGGEVKGEAKQLLAKVKEQQDQLQASGRARLASNSAAKQQNTPRADVMLVEVTGKKVNLRSGPGEEHSAVMQINQGIKLTVEDRQGDWYRVFTPTAGRAYIHRDFVKVIDDGTVRPATPAVSTARSARAPQKAVRTANEGQMVSFGAVKIGGRTPEAKDPESRAVQRLRSALRQQAQ